MDDRHSSSGTVELYYKMLSSAGTVLIDDTRITDNDGASSLRPQFVVDDSKRIFLVWQDKRNVDPHIFFARLEPLLDDRNGNAASSTLIKTVADTEISSTTGKQVDPRIALDASGGLHVVWENFTDSLIRYLRVDADGQVLVSERAVNSTGFKFYHAVPDVVVDSLGHAHVFWNQCVNWGGEEIYYSMLHGSSGSVLVAQSAITATDGYASNRQSVVIDTSDRIFMTWQDKKLEAEGRSVEVFFMALDPSLAATNGSSVAGTDIVTLDETLLSPDDGEPSFLPFSRLTSGGNVAISYFGQSVDYVKDRLHYMEVDTTGTVQAGPSKLSDTGYTSTGWSAVSLHENVDISFVWADTFFGNPEIVARSVSDDFDSDGYSPLSGDCNDVDSTKNPGVSESCNSLDEDCDGVIDDGNPGGGGSCDTGLDGVCAAGTYSCVAGTLQCQQDITATTEICDGLDNDCDGVVDEGFILYTYYADTDGDGFGSAAAGTVTCLASPPSGYVADSSDCADADSTVSPGADEICGDTVDNDCGAATADTWDADFDGYSCDVDCDEGNQNVNPGSLEICTDGIDNDCNGTTDVGYDADSDGWTTCDSQPDCNDANSLVNPGRSEICNDGLNNDCDGGTLDLFDGDSDGSTCDLDCDDSNSSVKPGLTEVCDGLDNDCANGVDDGLATSLFYADTDSDDYGNASASTESCLVSGPSGYVADSTDCDDSRFGVHPGAVEVCGDGLDNDCSSSTPDTWDGDSDTYACDVDCNDADPDVNPGAEEICGDGINNDCDPATPDQWDNDSDGFICSDCDDGDASVHPGAPEVCDGKDNDCDDAVDEGFDADADGWTTCGGDCNDGNALINPAGTETCNGVDEDCDDVVDNGFDTDADGWTSCGGDCNDADISISPGAVEICNGIDDDCDTVIDDGYDTDADGWTSCTGDCNDSDALVNPDGTEVCNGEDDDCDSVTDEGFDADGDGWTSCGGDCDDTDASVTPVDGDLDGFSVCDDPPDCDDTDAYFTPQDKDFDGVSTCDGDTNTGTDRATMPRDQVTGQTPVLITFSLVTQDFQTTLAIAESGFAPPAGFVPGTGQVWLEIETTLAAYSGTVEVCYTYDDAAYEDESVLKLFHDAAGDGTWVDVTTTLDTVSDTICGEVASLSTFAVFQAEPQPEITVNDSVGASDDLNLDFGDLQVGSAVSGTVTVINSGPGDLVLGSIDSAAALAPPFAVGSDSCSGATLQAAEECTFSIVFSPSISGSSSDSLTFATNDTDESSITVSLSGTGTGDSGGGGGGCFIATAAYGSYEAPMVRILRDFRDRYLLTNGPGRWLVARYYLHSPPAADWFRNRDGARAIVRVLLLPLIGFAWLLLNFSAASILATLLLVITMLQLRRHRRVRRKG